MSLQAPFGPTCCVLGCTERATRRIEKSGRPRAVCKDRVNGFEVIGFL